MDDDTDTTIRYDTPDDEASVPSERRVIQEDGAEGRGPGFDPTPYMRQLRGRGGAQEYLDVKWRLLWLRREHPDAQIITEHVQINETSAIFKATVSVPSGGRATGYGSETAGDFGDFIEKAETKAIGRALNALGYGAQFAEGDEEGVPPAPSRAAAQPRSNRPKPASSRAPIPIPTAPTPVAVPTVSSAADEAAPRAIAIDDQEEQDSRDSAASIDAAVQPTSPPRVTPDTAPARPDSESEPEPDMADYSHAAFWDWARPRGYQTREDVERAINRSMKGLTPKEVRRLLREAGAAE
ncbi:MAG TPA: hypothetical protein VGR16_03265 [Thermomicrobiales bacterium]|nr:hypothetical protein [Thermomicrobiales bacterium]